MSEGIVAPKFTTVFAENTPPDDPRLEELKHWCRIFHEKGLAPPYPGGSYGNLSFRVKPDSNQFIITGTNIGLKGQLDDSKFCHVLKVDPANMEVTVKGKIKSSSETMLHHAIYAARPDVNAVFHGHSQEILDNYKALGICCTESEKDYGTADLAEATVKALGKGNTAVMKGHGFICAAPSMSEAGTISVSLLSR